MGFFDKLKKINIFSSFGSELTDDFYDELEESLILADTGMDTTLELVEELRRRLVGRGTDAPEVIADRVAKAEYELGFAPKFDVVVVNDDLETAERQALDIIRNFLKK